MKRLRLISLLLASVLIITTITGCKKDEPLDNDPDEPSDHEFEQTVEPDHENPLRHGIIFSTGFALGYTLHNNTSNTFFYDSTYSLFRYEQDQWEHLFSREGEAALFSIDPGIIREYHIEWSDAIWEQGNESDHIRMIPGRYMLVRRLLINPRDPDEYRSLQIEFDIAAHAGNSTHRNSLRQAYLDFVMSVPRSTNIVLSGDVDASRSGIAFSLENRSGEEYVYGDKWELARFDNNQWNLVHPVDHVWLLALNTLRNGGIQRYEIQWDWVFGILPPGRYAWIREYSPSAEYPLPDRRYTKEFVVVEFMITEATPEDLVAQNDPDPFLHLTYPQDVTDSGINVMMENVSESDIRIHVYIGSIIQNDTWIPENEDYFWPEHGSWEWVFLRAGSSISLDLDWSLSHGSLPPGQYDLIIIAFGIAPPPHPTGGFQEVFEITVNIHGT